MRRHKRTLWPRLNRLSPTGQRKVAGFGILGIGLAAIYWSFFSDGLPILWGPSANAAEIAQGQELFEHEWAANDPLAHGDGLGPVFNARSCAACHFQGGIGGGGGLEHNAVGFEAFPRTSTDTFRTGTIHNFSVDPAYKETAEKVRALFPIVKGRTIQRGDPHCPYTQTIPDFDPVRTQSVQPTALFGAGWVDLIADRAIIRNSRARGIRGTIEELKLEFDGIPPGRLRMVSGGVGKFGWKGQFATLEEFVAAACANELGLGTPHSEQARPHADPNRTAAPDLDRKQFKALLSFVKTLPKPVETEPATSADHAAALRGKELFTAIGCAVCHVPNMGGVKGIYSDFLLYTISDPPPPGGGEYGPTGPPPELELKGRPDDEPRPDEWKTPALWGVADSAPYLHDGSAATLQDAILRHLGDAKKVGKKYREMPAADQAAVIAFLNTLRAPPTAPQLRDPSITRLAKR